jgi:hypothetical protein
MQATSPPASIGTPAATPPPFDALSQDQKVLFYGSVLEAKYQFDAPDAEWLDVASKDCQEYRTPSFNWYWPAEAPIGDDDAAIQSLGAEVMAFVMNATQNCGQDGPVPTGRFPEEFYSDLAAVASARIAVLTAIGDPATVRSPQEFLHNYTLALSMPGSIPVPEGVTPCNDGWVSSSSLDFSSGR